jgi:hypothetical protein
MIDDIRVHWRPSGPGARIVQVRPTLEHGLGTMTSRGVDDRVLGRSSLNQT